MDPLAFAYVSRFAARRTWSRGRHVFASGASRSGGDALAFVGSTLTDALAELIARDHARQGEIDA